MGCVTQCVCEYARPWHGTMAIIYIVGYTTIEGNVLHSVAEVIGAAPIVPLW
jgi:hypothetical protein